MFSKTARARVLVVCITKEHGQPAAEPKEELIGEGSSVTQRMAIKRSVLHTNHMNHCVTIRIGNVA